jgi:DNA-binding HxlR family transcriptional regulator
MRDFLSKIKEGTYEFKDPWRATDKSLTIIVPIVSTKKLTRDYVVLEEVKDKVRIVDTGGINQSSVEGNVESPTFIRGGTMLKGATQERATQFGLVMTPKNSEQIPVHCIHASRGIRPGAQFQIGGMSPRRVYSTILSERNQAQTWSEVTAFTGTAIYEGSEVHSREPTLTRIAPDDLVSAVESIQKFNSELKEVLKNIPDYTNQVGVVIIDPEGISGFEMYDHPDSWKAFSESIIRSYSEELSKEDRTGIFKPDMSAAIAATKELLQEIEKAEENEVYNKNKSRTVLLKTRDYVGEYTCLAGKTIHLLLTRRNPSTAPSRRLAPVLDFPRRRTPVRQSPIERLVNWGKRKMKKGAPVLEQLRERPRTWTDLRSDVAMSKATLSSRLKELQDSGIVEKHRNGNGAVRYSLTGIGHEAFRIEEAETLNLPADELHMFGDTSTPRTCPKCSSTRKKMQTRKGKTLSKCEACGHEWIEKKD